MREEILAKAVDSGEISRGAAVRGKRPITGDVGREAPRNPERKAGLR